MDDAATAERKRALRIDMRDRRKALVDREERSLEVAVKLAALPAVLAARRVMAYSTMGSEADTTPFVAWCVSHDIEVKMPEDEVDPTWPDVIVVPGLAFTAAGDRCGQGGGWYDRFLPGRRTDCTTIGVCFEVQLIESIPTGPFDLRVDAVISA